MTIKRVGALSAFQPVYDKIRDRSGDYLVTDLQGVAGEDDVDEGAGRIYSAECQCDDENCVDRLADDGGTDGAGPEHAAIGEEFEARHGVGVGELAGPEGDETGGKDAWDEAEDCREGLLVAPSGCGRQRDNDGSDEVEERSAEEPQPDGAARGSKAVDLGEYVSEDVGDGKEQDRAANGEGADRPSADAEGTDETDLLRDEIGDEQDHDERGCEGVEIFVAASGRGHRARRVRWAQYQYAASVARMEDFDTRCPGCYRCRRGEGACAAVIL